MGEIGKDVTTIALAIVGVAVLAILVSRNANTSGVLNSASSAYNSALATAEGPVTGYNPGPPIYATGGGGFGLSMLENTAGFQTGQLA